MENLSFIKAIDMDNYNLTYRWGMILKSTRKLPFI